MAHAMFATGNSQLGFVEALLSGPPTLPWADVVVFHMDEYVGVGPDHPAGFRHWIHDRIDGAAHRGSPTTSTGWPSPEASAPATAGSS